MDKISSLIPKVLNKRGLKDEAQASYVVFLATEWIAEQLPALAEQVQVESMRDGVLSIETSHSAVSQEIAVQKEALLAHLNSFEGILLREVCIQRKK